MLKLRSVNSSPAGGFRFVDKSTGFRAHGWSLRSAAAQWFQEQLNRGRNVTLEQAMADVERFTCEDLMKATGWEQWVMVVTPQNPFIPSIMFKQKEVSVSVVIPVYDSDIRVMKVIDSIKDQSNEIRIIIGGKIQPRFDSEIVKSKVGIHYDSSDLGFGQKCNLGASRTKSEFIWFLNDDCYPLPGCRDHLINVMLANPKIGMVGHLLRYPNGFIQHAGTERVQGQVGFPHRDIGKLHPSLKVPTEMEAVTAASVMVRREAFEDVGGFDEGYFLYLEDTDLCLKMRQAGWKVYFTPFAEAVHEEHVSSVLRPDLNQIIKKSVARFADKWSSYFSQPPPQFQSFGETTEAVKIDAVYVHLVGHEGYEKAAKRFVDSMVKFPPGQEINWIIACNSPFGNQISDQMKSVFSHLGNVTYFRHDNSGWDIGAFQAYSKISQADLCLFFGGTSYARHRNWAQYVTTSFKLYGADAMYGVCGNLGDQNVRVSPHVRTTGFWCAPKLLNAYPHIARRPEDRYPIEHGPNCLTMWCWSQGYQVYLVTTDSILGFPDWDNPPNGFHRGNQSELIFGDRITEPPYFAHP